MVASRTCASRELLPREVRQLSSIVLGSRVEGGGGSSAGEVGLVGEGAEIARVVGAGRRDGQLGRELESKEKDSLRPNAVGSGTMSCATEVTHGPCACASERGR